MAKQIELQDAVNRLNQWVDEAFEALAMTHPTDPDYADKVNKFNLLADAVRTTNTLYFTHL